MKSITCTLHIVVFTFALVRLLPFNAHADEPKVLLENVLQARYQYTNFDASIVVDQLHGQLWEMPKEMQYDMRIDEVNGRYWHRMRPLVAVHLENIDIHLLSLRSQWLESAAMYRDHRWSHRIGGELILSSKPTAMMRRGFSAFTLGFSVFPRADWTSKSIESYRGLFGLNAPANRFTKKPDDRVFNGAMTDRIDCLEESGALRTFWIERGALRLHRSEIPYPIESYKLTNEERGTLTVESTFSSENETVIPDHVLICETINGLETKKISMKLIRFERDKIFKDEDFSFTNMGLGINQIVSDSDTGRALGYWNGHDWSSKVPITGGNVVNAAIEASNKPTQNSSVLQIVAISSSALAGILLLIWLRRRFRKPN